MEASNQKRPHPGNARRWRIGLLAAIVFHLLLLGMLGAWYVHHRAGEEASPIAASTSVSSSPNQPQSPDITKEQVAATIERSLKVHGDKSDEEQLDAFDRHAEKLERISSEESVDEITIKFQEWMDIPRRATQPIEPAADPEAAQPNKQPSSFDFNTALIHEVLREELPEGGYRYVTILIDANGLTFETEIDEAEGATAYATFQRMKKFPLAEKVYRQLAMPIMEKILADQAADKPIPPIVKVPTAAGGDDDRDPFDGE